MAGTHVTSPNQQASLHSSERKDIKKDMCISLSVSYFGSTATTANQQYSQLYPFYKIFCHDFSEYSVIRQIWAWLGYEKGVDP